MNRFKTLTRHAFCLLLCLMLFSCSDKQVRCYVCDEQQRLQVADFISKNIKNANNMSDEEMEDVISELRDTGIKLYCRQEFIPTSWDGDILYDKIKKDSLQTYYPYLY
jgi:hypothetical protein